MKQIDAQAITDSAHSWRAILAEGAASPAEQQDFDEWFAADSRHREAFLQAEQVWQQLGRVDTSQMDPALFKPSLHERVRVGLFNTFSKPQFGLALASVCLLVLGLLLQTVLVDPTLVQSQYQTNKGEIQTVTLTDGSILTLGADSAVDIHYSGSKRMVRLLKGVGYFDVAKDPKRPFEVHAHASRTVAVGTAFDVAIRNTNIQVAVAEGTVDVSHPEPHILSQWLIKLPEVIIQRLHKEQRQRLQAGNAISASYSTGLHNMKAVNVAQIGSWQNGRLTYVDATLADVVADASRYYAKPIVVIDSRLTNISVTATFSAKDIDGMLTTLEEVFPLRIDRSAANKVVLLGQ